MFQIFPTKLPPEQVGRRRFDMDSPIRDGRLAYARPMCALSLRADIDGRDSLDGYRNRSRYYQGIAHEVPIRAVAATVMSVQGQSRHFDPLSATSGPSPITDIAPTPRD